MFMRRAIRMDMRDDGVVLMTWPRPSLRQWAATASANANAACGARTQSVERSEGKRRSEPKSLASQDSIARSGPRRHGVQGQSSAEAWPHFATFLGQTESMQLKGLGAAAASSRVPGESLRGARATMPSQALNRPSDCVACGSHCRGVGGGQIPSTCDGRRNGWRPTPARRRIAVSARLLNTAPKPNGRT